MADMSGVVEQINRISTNILESFVKVEEKGGTLPSVLNSNNLPDAIESITGGGGEEYEGQYHYVTSVTPPYIEGSYTYTGQAQTVNVVGFDSEIMNETGDSRTQTNHRDEPYRLTWTLKDPDYYVWDGTSEESVTGEWVMQKASLPVTISGSLSWGTGTGDKTVTINNPARTALTIESTNNTQFKISDSGTIAIPAGTSQYTLKVTHESATGASGSINVTSAGDNNHVMTTASVDCSSSTPSCVASDTLITLADGSKKRIDELTYDDLLLTYNLNNGEYESKEICKLYYDGEEDFNCLNLTFDNGSVVKMMTTHGFLNCTKREYSQITLYNYEDYIGDEFLTEDGRAVLVAAEIIPERTGAWSLITKNNENFITEGIVSMTGDRGAVFVIADDMKYDAELKQHDIETYGLFTYEEFEGRITESDFYDLNCPDYKVLVGKGIIDMDYIYHYLPLLVEEFVV